VIKDVPIAAVSFCSHKEERERLFISMCAVSSFNYSQEFGRSCDKAPWRKRGLCRFLFLVCRRIHRSVHHLIPSEDLWVLMCPLRKAPSLQCFKIIGFLRVALSFKDCYGFPFAADTATFIDENSGTTINVLKCVPFLADGEVYGCIGKKFYFFAEPLILSLTHSLFF